MLQSDSQMPSPVMLEAAWRNAAAKFLLSLGARVLPSLRFCVGFVEQPCVQSSEKNWRLGHVS